MFVSEETLDDLLHVVFEKILKEGTKIPSSSKGSNTELWGVLLELRNPLARLSRTEMRSTAFSCLGETLWYLAGSNELSFIQYYLSRYQKSAETDGTIWGAYGPRLFKMRQSVNQIESVIGLLRKKPETRQAVIQLFDAEDILEAKKDIPCTCTLQFLKRDGKLNLFVSMRSNDAYTGLPHDVFAFTLIQEIIARSIDLEIGVYRHAAASLHIYDDCIDGAKKYLTEAWQEKILMPSMPLGDPWPHIKQLVSAEADIRNGDSVDLGKKNLPGYWADLARLLLIFQKGKTKQELNTLKEQMDSKIFHIYIDKRIALAEGSE
ncbi:MAG: thymidylate synthase [Xanthobacteraceae bacterium]|jgi:thymidylate synthase|nr:thymidylate synthase [Xanthobacteraceae bacterium]